MAYCVKCGTKVEDTVKFCPQCGEAIPQVEKKAESADAVSNGREHEHTYHQEQSDSEEYFNREEVSRNRAMGVLSYIGILVLISILAGDKKSEYVRHHVNQGLALYIVSTLIELLDGESVFGLRSLISFGGGPLSWVFEIAEFACFILMVMGIVYACKGKKTELPLIGKIKFWS